MKAEIENDGGEVVLRVDGIFICNAGPTSKARGKLLHEIARRINACEVFSDTAIYNLAQINNPEPTGLTPSQTESYDRILESDGFRPEGPVMDTRNSEEPK